MRHSASIRSTSASACRPPCRASQSRQGEDPYAAIDDVASLLALVQIGVLELHVWGSRAEHLDQPDMIVFDLDPAEDVPWREVATAALDVKERLEALGLNAFVKLTGGKGLHVVVPMSREPRGRP